MRKSGNRVNSTIIFESPDTVVIVVLVPDVELVVVAFDMLLAWLAVDGCKLVRIADKEGWAGATGTAGGSMSMSECILVSEHARVRQ